MSPEDAEVPDAVLVEAVLGGDREAFAAVYDRYADRLHDFAQSLLRHREEAADSVADAFVIMAERLEQLRALENGIAIAVCKVDYDAIGVDVPEDVQRVEALLAEQNE